MKKIVVAGALLAAAGALAGCSHSCVPPGWYHARAVHPMQRPPNAPKINHDSSYDVPGGLPDSGPTRNQACLVEPPNALTQAAPASASAGKHTAATGRQ